MAIRSGVTGCAPPDAAHAPMSTAADAIGTSACRPDSPGPCERGKCIGAPALCHRSTCRMVICEETVLTRNDARSNGQRTLVPGVSVSGWTDVRRNMKLDHDGYH